MRVQDLPLPLVIASRPRDPLSGVWVPAITHWRDGVPRWGEASGERQLLCALQRRCGVCGRRFADDETEWHAIGKGSATLVDYVLRRGGEPAEPMITREVPGHEICMMFAALACPFLASPQARRRQDGDGLLRDVRAGQPRGDDAALAGFGPYRLRLTPDRPDVVFALELAQPRKLHHYQNGTELLEQLAELVTGGEESTEPEPPFLGEDDDAAIAELHRERQRSRRAIGAALQPGRVRR